MKDIVTFETAVRLKEAGFPQPTPEAGQWWHNPDFGLFVVGAKWFADNREYKIFYPGTGKSVLKSEARFLECAFAPTATDAEAWLKLNEPREQKIARASKTWAGTDTSMFMKDIKQG